MSGGDAAARLTPSRVVLAFAACGFAGLYLLFAVVPVLASRSGGRIGAGLLHLTHLRAGRARSTTPGA
jgi:hypothetical protein